ncbi:DoxX family protein [Rhizobium sp. S152]|uniref:DoxX family protein n=1 Tax=Rhizobium sp. S152 TaxID=3055038 RepID=UPI0025A9631D|nr:DoxX family protein [Rhizobium sp. S152]MDM9625743.1 DoxX family protein [Rhizobium sp. S152]
MTAELSSMTGEVSRSGVIAGWCLSGIVTLAMLADAGANLFAPQLLAADMAASGFPPELAPVLGIIILVCAVLYFLPTTAVLGAILTTGFFGGAISIHFRLGEFLSPPQMVCVVLGIAAWAGLYLRDRRIRELLPFRR